MISANCTDEEIREARKSQNYEDWFIEDNLAMGISPDKFQLSLIDMGKLIQASAEGDNRERAYKVFRTYSPPERLEYIRGYFSQLGLFCSLSPANRQYFQKVMREINRQVTIKNK